LADAVVAALAGRQPEVSRFVLNDLKIRGCQSCFSCKTRTEACVLNDDLVPVLGAVAAADLVVAATPVYIGEVSAQLKLFIDRSYSWYTPDFRTSPSPSRLAPGKTLVLVVTQGHPDPEAYRRNLDFYSGYFSSHGFKVRLLQGVGLQAEDVAEARPDLMEAAAALASEL
jgi:multimeric flavodoxin WrbA